MRAVLFLTTVLFCYVSANELCRDALKAGKFKGKSDLSCPEWKNCADCKWFQVDKCHGQCGGGSERHARLRTCHYADSQKNPRTCVERQVKSQTCQMQCGTTSEQGFYNPVSKQCHCGTGWTGQCCQQHVVADQNGSNSSSSQLVSVNLAPETAKVLPAETETENPGAEEETEIECKGGPEDVSFHQLRKHCSKYVVCQGRWKRVMVCPRGLFFSRKRMACLYPEEVPECGKEVVCSGDPEDVSFHLDLQDCNKYFVCQGKRRHHMPCYDGLFFSLRQMACLQPENVPECYNNDEPVAET